MITIFCIVLLVILTIYIYNNINGNINDNMVSIRDSTIHGEGIFINKDIKKNTIIMDNLFPHKPANMRLYDPISGDRFSTYISRFGSKVNHCSSNYNSSVVSKDNETFKLKALRDIKAGEEVTANYDKIHQKFPFIDTSHSHYNRC